MGGVAVTHLCSSASSHSSNPFSARSKPFHAFEMSWQRTTHTHTRRSATTHLAIFSVPARHISESAAPCPYCLAPRPNSLVPCPSYLAPCPNSLAPCSIYSALPEYNFFCTYNFCFCFQTADELYNASRFVPVFSSIGHKIVPRSRFVRSAGLCPNIGRSRARFCPISFAPCPFPNPAGTLILI